VRPAQKNVTERRTPILGVLAALALILTGGVLFGRHGAGRYLTLREDLARRSKQAVQRINRNRDMIERLEGLRTDDRVLEEVARSTLGVVDEDEIVVVFDDRRSSRRR